MEHFKIKRKRKAKKVKERLEMKESLAGIGKVWEETQDPLQLIKEPFPHIERDYQIDPQKLIGKGSFAEVYVCIQRNSGREFAVKVVDKSKFQGRFLARLYLEKEILTRLSHSTMSTIYDFYETEKSLYMISELATGGDLKQNMKAYYKNEVLVIKTIRNLCNGLEYLHSLGIGHRDLKPANILVRSPDDLSDIFITDFGLSRYIDEEDLFQTICGTYLYLAPEVLDQKGYDFQVDMWAVGIITYRLLSGEYPFIAKDLKSFCDLLRRPLYANFEARQWEGLSTLCKQFISGLLVRDPKSRLTASGALQHPWLHRRGRIRLVRHSDLQTKHQDLGVVISSSCDGRNLWVVSHKGKVGAVDLTQPDLSIQYGWKRGLNTEASQKKKDTPNSLQMALSPTGDAWVIQGDRHFLEVWRFGTGFSAVMEFYFKGTVRRPSSFSFQLQVSQGRLWYGDKIGPSIGSIQSVSHLSEGKQGELKKFSLRIDGKEITFKAPSQLEAVEWVANLNQCIQFWKKGEEKVVFEVATCPLQSMISHISEIQNRIWSIDSEMRVCFWSLTRDPETLLNRVVQQKGFVIETFPNQPGTLFQVAQDEAWASFGSDIVSISLPQLAISFSSLPPSSYTVSPRFGALRKTHAPIGTFRCGVVIGEGLTKEVWFGGSDGFICIWSVEKQKVVHEIIKDEWDESPVLKKEVTGRSFIDSESSRTLWSSNKETGDVVALCVCGDKIWCAVGGKDGLVFCIESESRKIPKTSFQCAENAVVGLHTPSMDWAASRLIGPISHPQHILRVWNRFS